MLLIKVHELINKDYMKTIKNTLQDISFLDQLLDKIRDYEKMEYDFTNCNEVELIYFYIHKQNRLFYGNEESTKKDYIRELVYFYIDVSEQFTSLKELTVFHMEDYQKYLLHVKKYKKNTINKKSTIIKSFLSWLYEIGYLERNIVRDMKSTQIKLDDQPIKELNFSEVKSILHFYKNKYIGDYLLILLLSTTGLRIFELAKAKWGDILIEESSGLPFLSIVGKGGKRRSVLIFDKVMDIIITYRERRGLKGNLGEELDTPLFPKPNRKHFSENYLSQRVSHLIKEALPEKAKQFPISAHSLRHAFAQIARKDGADLLSIQEALGHSDPRTTRRYLSRQQEMKHHAAKKINIQKFF